MKEKSLLVASALLSLSLPMEGQLVKNTRPNVVLIIADDHRYDWMHHKGRNYMETPHLDSLALQGWSFTNAFSCAGVCSPARASIFTGKYLHQASAPDIVWQNNSFLKLQEMFPQSLHKQGYKTGYIGKFHLGEEEKPKPGFDLWASFPFVGNYFDQTIRINGKPAPQKGFTDDNIAGLAVKTIKEWSGSGQPFCLLVGLKSPHIPFTFPDRMKTLYNDVVFKEPETFNLNYSKSKPGLSNNLINAKTWSGAIPKYGSFQEWVRSYTRLATTIDESVGQIMDAVSEAGLKENTIFIYTSDQGYSLGEFSLCEKHYAYEQIMRVPLIVRFPNQKSPGNPPSDMVMNMDIAPTVMDYCTGNVPGDMSGKSWRVLLEPKNAKRKPLREEVFFDFWHRAREILPPMQAVRTEQYKLIKYEYQPYEELYDLVNDPLEKTNLTDDIKYSSIKGNLEKRLESWKKNTGWSDRTSVNLNSIYISKSSSLSEGQQGSPELLNPKIREITGNNEIWKKLTRQGSLFNLKDFIPDEAGDQSLYIAIPLRNGAKFDPFISLSITFPNNKKALPAALTGYFEGKEIYMNMAYKKKMKIPEIDKLEEPLRQMFDLGYNPPLKPGENVILLRMLVNKETPKEIEVSVIGGLSKIGWQ